MIHPSAIIDPKARLASDVKVGPFCTIGPEVTIGSGTVLHSNVVIEGKTSIGENNQIFPFSFLGMPPQDIRPRQGSTELHIGSNNIIRQHVSIAVATQMEQPTRVGDHNFIMGHSHIGHDCSIGDHTTITQGVGLSGFVQVEDHAVLGGQSGAHQFVRIGTFAMIGGKSAMFKDIPPFTTVMGIPSHYVGCNKIALQRASYPAEVIQDIDEALKILFRQGLPLEESLPKIEQTFERKEIDHLVGFIKSSKRGICGSGPR